jgi:hypothetical protein
MAGHVPTPEQKKRAIASALVLAALVAAIYGVFLLKVLAR